MSRGQFLWVTIEREAGGCWTPFPLLLENRLWAPRPSSCSPRHPDLTREGLWLLDGSHSPSMREPTASFLADAGRQAGLLSQNKGHGVMLLCPNRLALAQKVPTPTEEAGHHASLSVSHSLAKSHKGPLFLQALFTGQKLDLKRKLTSQCEECFPF